MTLRFGLYLALLVLAIFNGVHAPLSFMVFALQGIWYPDFLPATLSLMFFLSGVVSAVLHVLITGVPVALFEKTVLYNQNLSAFLWLGVMILPTVRTLRYLGWL